jgi:hypothetical protein
VLRLGANGFEELRVELSPAPDLGLGVMPV